MTAGAKMCMSSKSPAAPRERIGPATSRSQRCGPSHLDNSRGGCARAGIKLPTAAHRATTHAQPVVLMAAAASVAKNTRRALSTLPETIGRSLGRGLSCRVLRLHVKCRAVMRLSLAAGFDRYNQGSPDQALGPKDAAC